MLGDGGEDLDRQLGGVRVVASDKVDATLLQRADEEDVAGEPVELGDDQGGAAQPAAERTRVLISGAGGSNRLRSSGESGEFPTRLGLIYARVPRQRHRRGDLRPWIRTTERKLLLGRF